MDIVLLCIAALAATAASGWLVLGEVNAVIWLSVAFSGFVTVKLSLANLMPTGHGVNGSRHILGMPMFIFGIYLFMLCIILFLMLTNEPTLLPITNANFRVFGLGLFWGWAAGVTNWYATSSRLTYFASEYQERMKLKAMGIIGNEADKLIDKFRRKGFFPPK